MLDLVSSVMEASLADTAVLRSFHRPDSNPFFRSTSLGHHYAHASYRRDMSASRMSVPPSTHLVLSCPVYGRYHAPRRKALLCAWTCSAAGQCGSLTFFTNPRNAWAWPLYTRKVQMRLTGLSLADFLPLHISRINTPWELGDFLLSFYEDFLSLLFLSNLLIIQTCRKKNLSFWPAIHSETIW
jgi:hypothetical protein